MDRSSLNRRTALMGLAGGLGLGAIGMSVGSSSGDGATSQVAAKGGIRGGPGSCSATVSDGDAIQAAINAASDGDEICVGLGTYDGGLRIDVPDLTLRTTSPLGATIDATGLGSGVRIQASGVTIEGFEIVGDSDTTTGITIETSAGATSDITIRGNLIHGMAKGGGGGPFAVSSWGILSWGDTPLSGVLIEDNTIEEIGGSEDALPIGIGIDLEEVSGDHPTAGAVVRRNTISGMAGAEVSLADVVDGVVGDLVGLVSHPLNLDRAVTLPGVGIAVQPLGGESSGAGSPATDVHQNTIDETALAVLLGTVGMVRVYDNE